MNVELIRYNAACRALAEAKRVDEVKSIRDKAVAMQVYAEQAKDRRLIEDATEIRMRAERRAGELLAEMKKRGERQKSGEAGGRAKDDGSKRRPSTPKLSDLGVSKTQSARWQALAELDGETFESQVASARKRASNGLDAIHREIRQCAERGSAKSPRAAQRKATEAQEKKAARKPNPRYDIGPASTSEMARKDAEIEELRNTKCRLEIENADLRSAAAKPAPQSKSAFRCSICHEKKQAALLPVFICDSCVEIHEVREAAPAADDGLDIPEFLRRGTGASHG